MTALNSVHGYNTQAEVGQNTEKELGAGVSIDREPRVD